MDKLRDLLRAKMPSYKPVEDQDDLGQDHDPLMGGLEESTITIQEPRPFYWPYYAVFALLGVAMLWAWYVYLIAN